MEALRLAGEFSQLISELPNGFLQTRMVNFNYRTLRNIYLQRGGHKLPEWSAFIQEVLASINHPEFINNKKE